MAGKNGCGGELGVIHIIHRAVHMVAVAPQGECWWPGDRYFTITGGGIDRGNGGGGEFALALQCAGIAA